MIELSPHARGTVLRVRAQPGAHEDRILGERAGSLRVGVTDVPEKGKANAAIVTVLAEALGCRGSGLVLLSGETSRDKRFLVLEIDADAILRRLESSVSRLV